MWTKYISKEHYGNIRNFKYSGSCNSILYKYVLSDWAQFLVDRMPRWLAPNIITLTGFAFLISALILSAILNPNFDTPLSSSFCFYSAFCVFAYQTLDNCDGKQARRTGSSTALGMLLDHGTDSMATWLIGLLMATVFNVPQSPMLFISLLFSAKISFFFGVYQQYHTGMFVLDEINAVDEGLPFIQATMIFTGIVGPEFWRKAYIFGIPNYSLMMVFSIVGGLATIASFGVSVFKKLKWNPFLIFKSLSLPLTLTFTYFVIALLSPSKVLETHFRCYVLLLGFQWSKMINLWQLCIISKDEFSQADFSWILTNGVIVINIIFGLLSPNHECFIDEGLLAYLLLVYSFVTYSHTVLSIVRQLCEILKIEVFRIKPDL